jgi:hypothetical protein
MKLLINLPVRKAFSIFGLIDDLFTYAIFSERMIAFHYQKLSKFLEMAASRKRTPPTNDQIFHFSEKDCFQFFWIRYVQDL